MPSFTYSAVPREDHDEPTKPTQSPPGYQAQADPAPRGDDIPDDMKYGVNAAESEPDIRRQFVRKVYAILAVQLSITAVMGTVTICSATIRNWMINDLWMFWVSLVASLVFLGLTLWKRRSYPLNLVFLTVFTLFEGYTVSLVVTLYDTKIVVEAVILTIAALVGLTCVAMWTKYDFSSWQSVLFGGLWMVIAFGFMMAFFPKSSVAELVYGIVAALLFSAYILYDTQSIMRRYHVEEEIAAAVSLYIDIINLFLAILRILNFQSSD